MKNALRKFMPTDTDKQTEQGLEVNIPLWREDERFMKWTAKEQEISLQLQTAESEQRHIKEQIEAAQKDIVQAKSALILEEGTKADLEAAESNVATLLQKEKSLELEVKALIEAQKRAKRETEEAEEEARSNAMTTVLPIYQQKVAKTLEILQAAETANEEVKAFEALVSQSGLTLNHGSFGSRHVINNLAFPVGLKEFRASVEALLNKKTL